MYLDTAILVKLVVREPDSDFYADLIDGQPAWSSQLVLVEGLSDVILEACHPSVAVRSLDALHLASAERSQSWPLCSNDGRMRAAATRLGLPLAPLP